MIEFIFIETGELLAARDHAHALEIFKEIYTGTQAYDLVSENTVVAYVDYQRTRPVSESFSTTEITGGGVTFISVVEK